MKVRYLANISIASILGLGLAFGCANPCAGQEAPAGVTDPCAGDPCAGDPCAGDPCAGNSHASVGGPLASELHGKPVLVDVFATWCAACENIAPTLAQLKEDYDETVNFVILDVSDRSTTAEAEAKAKELGLQEFLEANKSQTGMLTIVEPETGRILAQHRNNPNLEDYTTVLDPVIQ
ncbi:TlpA family protein disulfide reductase [Sodalinema gerasimenkoae]|uniref:TlpA family protein disulfide reductase n=1 Tax=Sodalinema gerasimenkoae TaxID=2862348 RepID=UPI001357BE38|nr:thioredoxin domain-containing protein [Sodalinema gerasimenkoae]